LANDPATDCTALALLPQYAARLGFPPTVESGSWKATKRRGKIVGWRWVKEAIENPSYVQLLQYARAWHRDQFHADC
jgi:hypothetical protein